MQFKGDSDPILAQILASRTAMKMWKIRFSVKSDPRTVLKVS